jgi:hypothetical protein
MLMITRFEDNHGPGIPISSFKLSTDLQAELHLLNQGGDGNIRAIDVGVATSGIVNKKRG